MSVLFQTFLLASQSFFTFFHGIIWSLEECWQSHDVCGSVSWTAAIMSHWSLLQTMHIWMRGRLNLLSFHSNSLVWERSVVTVDAVLHETIQSLSWLSVQSVSSYTCHHQRGRVFLCMTTVRRTQCISTVTELYCHLLDFKATVSSIFQKINK